MKNCVYVWPQTVDGFHQQTWPDKPADVSKRTYIFITGHAYPSDPLEQPLSPQALGPSSTEEVQPSDISSPQYTHNA